MSSFSDVQLFLRSLFEADTEVSQPQPGANRFGARGFRVAGKVFAMETRGALALKLPAGRVHSLVEQGSGRVLEMGGRVQKEWIVVDDHSAWSALAQEARAFVAAAGAPGR